MTAIIRKLVVEGGMYKIEYATHYKSVSIQIAKKNMTTQGGKKSDNGRGERKVGEAAQIIM